MRIKQVSVFVSNEPGRLVDMLKPLSDNEIDIQALQAGKRANVTAEIIQPK